MKFSEYKQLSEEKLIALAKEENNYAAEILIERYIKMLYWICQNYYVKGADKDDVMQIALISFHKSIFYYKKSENSLSFRNFVVLCVRREIISFLKHTNSLKNELLNNAIPAYSHTSSSRESEDNESSLYLANKILRDYSPSPEEIVIGNEVKKFIHEEIKSKLSDLEKNVLVLKLKGYTYKEISRMINRKEKAIDNSVQRIRKKIKDLYEELKVI